MGARYEGQKIAQNMGRISDAGSKAFSPEYWRDAKNAPAIEKVAASEGIFSKLFGGIGKVIVAPVKWGIKAGVGIIDFSAGIVMKPLKAVSGGLANAFERSPRTAVAATVVLGAVGAAHMVGKHRSKKMEMQRDALADVVTTQAAAANAPTSYMNSASYAPVQAKIDADRANSDTPAAASFADRAAARTTAGPAV